MGPEPEPVAADPVTIGELAPVTVTPGGRTEVRLEVSIAKGHRVQANPASTEFLVPLTVELEEIGGLLVGNPIYPEGEPYRLQGTDEDLSTYAGSVEVVIPLDSIESTSVGTYDLAGSLHFQACNSRVCLFPASVPIKLSIIVVEPETTS